MRPYNRRVLALSVLTTPAAAERQVVVHVDASEVDVEELTVEFFVQDETVSVSLDDSGRLPHDVPSDGLWSGAGELPYARWTQLRLLADGEELVTHFERSDEEGPLSYGWTLRRLGSGELEARRAVGTWPGAPGAVTPDRALLVSFGWGLLALGYVGLVVFLQRRR